MPCSRTSSFTWRKLQIPTSAAPLFSGVRGLGNKEKKKKKEEYLRKSNLIYLQRLMQLTNTQESVLSGILEVGQWSKVKWSCKTLLCSIRKALGLRKK